jgi:hypothetical protein
MQAYTAGYVLTNVTTPKSTNSSPGYKAWEQTRRKHRLAIV